MLEKLKQLIGGNFRQLAMVVVLLLEIVLFQVLTGGTVLSAQNLQNVISGNAYVLILAMGMVLVIIAGHIDLSVGSVAAVVGIVLAVLTTSIGLPWWVGILGGLGVGVVIGLWHGFWVAIVGVPAFVVTLAGMLMFRGLNQYIGNSNSIPVPQEVRKLGAGYMNFLPPIETGNWIINSPTVILAVGAALLFTALKMRSRAKLVRAGAEVPPAWAHWTQIIFACAVLLGLGWVFATGRPGTSFPIPGVLVIALFLFYNFLARNTPLGRSVYAVGGNRTAAALTGISVRKVNFFVMFNSSVLAAIAGMVFVGRSTASTPFDGTMWELDAIASVFIGGASVWGGIGTVGGTMVGALVMAFLNNGLQLMGAGADWTQMIKGLVLLLAVAFDVISKLQGKPSIIGHLLKKRPATQGEATAEPVADKPDVA